MAVFSFTGVNSLFSTNYGVFVVSKGFIMMSPFLRPRSHENGTERNGTERNGTERNGTERNGTERNGTERNDIELFQKTKEFCRCSHEDD